MKHVLLIVALAGLPACTLQERHGAISDLGAYVGAPEHPDGSIERDSNGLPIYDGQPDYDPREVAVAAAQEAAKRAGDPAGLAIWAAIAGVTVAVGWFKRRVLASAAKEAMVGLGRVIIQKPAEPPAEEDKE